MLGEDISESGAKGKVSNTDPIGHGLSFISSKAWTRHACSFLVEGTCFSGRSPLGMDGASEGHLLRQLHFVPLQVQSSILGCSSSSGLLHPAVLSHCHSGGPHAQPPCRNQTWWQQRAQMAPAASMPTRPNSPFLK